MSKYIIELSKKDVVIFTIAAAIILEYTYVAFVAMSGNGTVTNDFNRYNEGWIEVFLMFITGLYLLIKTFGSKTNHEVI